MKHFLDINHLHNMEEALAEMKVIKANPFSFSHLGRFKTLGMLFFNASLRTRLSTEKAAKNLGMEVLTLNVNSDSWQLEFIDSTVMDTTKAEHIKEAAAVLSQYCDVLAIRAFPSLENREEDEKEYILKAFTSYASVPIINLESSTRHPLQGLTDVFTIHEITERLRKQGKKPNVVLTWAPHPKALPQAVANSFIETLQEADVQLVITHPKGYELDAKVVKNTKVTYNQDEAFKDADIVYVKNWSSYTDYGKVLPQDKNWLLNTQKLEGTNNAAVMHCLPVRRNVVIADDVLDSKASKVIQQAGNRTYAAQYVLKKILENGN